MATVNRLLQRKCALALSLSLVLASGVSAQTNTAGAVTGQAASGDTITVTNPTTGFSRTITVGGDGTYRFSQLPIGQYQVSRNGGAPRTVNVSVGTAANVDFVAAGQAGGELDTIEVVGAGAINPIDVSSVESTTILTAEQIAKIPVPRDTTSVALLAPGTVRGDAAFGNLASFGGASVAENQYYVNGFNITNSFRGLNFSNVPFEAIQEQQIKTGGYGAEFGRSLGGVINQITKRGTNDFHAGGNIFWAPEQLREDGKSVYLTNGSLRADNSQDSSRNVVASAWASGAVIKDRLFAYGLVSYRKQEDTNFGSIVSSSNTSASTKTPSWLLKMDWNITDSNLVELTAFSDSSDINTDVYQNVPGSTQRGALIGTNVVEQGGDNYILKYTGFLTDTFTLSALYGHGEFSRSQRLRLANGTEVAYQGELLSPVAGCPVVVDVRPKYRRDLTGTYASHCNLTGGLIDRADSGDTRDQFRVDAEWQLGDHLLRFGYDRDDYESVAGQAYEGGRLWRYSTVDPDAIPNSGDEVDRVREQVVSQGSTNKVKQHAYYIQDSWNITDNFIAYLGGRWDTFENIDGLGNTFAKIDNQFGPRLGFSWDVFGDSTFKVFGNAGRYALPLTPSVAVRGASQSLFTREDYNFTTVGGTVDPLTGAPIDASGVRYGHDGSTSRGNFRYVNGEFGTPKNPLTVTSQNLDPMYQDEYILGMQKALTDHFSLGVRAIYRNLKAAIDDNCDYTAVMHAGGYNYDDASEQWLNSAGEAAVIPSDGFPFCRMFNPGKDAIFLTDFQNNGKLTAVTVPGSTLSPKAKRKYQAMEFFFDGNWDKFFLQGSYTYAKSIGNTEGGVKSDIGQNTTSTTQDFDYIELTVDTYGYLPNDRRHSLKLFGNYELTDEWSVGANLLVQSGRPVNCLGVLDRDPLRAPGAPPRPDPVPGNQPGQDNGYNPHPYGSGFMRCNNLPVPRGTAGRLPWTTNVDMNVSYAPNWAEGLQFKFDVFNVLNSQKVTSVSEVAEDSATGSPLETYLAPTSFQAPRSVRLMVQYDF